MKIARVIQDDKETFGIINGEFFFRTKSNTKNKIHTLQELIILINREINNSSNHILEVDSFFEGIGYPLTSLKVLPPTTEKNKIITFFSSFTARSFISQMEKYDLTSYCQKKKFIVISDNVKNELNKARYNYVLTASEPNEEKMIQLIEKQFNKDRKYV